MIPDRPPLELDKLPPYHDVAPSPGEYIDSSVTIYLIQAKLILIVQTEKVLHSSIFQATAHIYIYIHTCGRETSLILVKRSRIH